MKKISQSRLYDKHIQDIADYVLQDKVSTRPLAMKTAHYCLFDSLACAMLALSYPACTKLLGPIVDYADMPGRGARVPGTAYELEPVCAAFNIGSLIRWLDYNDTWLAAEWGHPSDNLGGILATADYLSRSRRAAGKQPLYIHEVLVSSIKAYEIQGVLAMENAFNRVGLDHVMLVRIASTAVITQLLGGNREEIMAAVSNAWIDGCALRTYRHAPNTGSRKSWAAGDATARGVQFALTALRGEMGYTSALSAPVWGFEDSLMRGGQVVVNQKYASYVMENVLFKISYPAEFHAQTAVDAAIQLHPKVRNRIDEIERISVETQEAGKRIIDKTGPLHNPADRDHCIQYMIAIGLLRGQLSAEDYEDRAAANPMIDKLRTKMEVKENKSFTRDYFAPQKRAIPNALQVFFKQGDKTPRVQVDYPIGHKKRRKEGIPLLREKFLNAVATRLPPKQCAFLSSLLDRPTELQKISVDEFMEFFRLT